MERPEERTIERQEEGLEEGPDERQEEGRKKDWILDEAKDLKIHLQQYNIHSLHL